MEDYVYGPPALYLIVSGGFIKTGLLSSPSPDGSGNPFMPGFGTKDCNGQRKEIKKSIIYN